MAIVGGFDVHRAQITFDYLDTETGEVCTGQIRPATRPPSRLECPKRPPDRDGPRPPSSRSADVRGLLPPVSCRRRRWGSSQRAPMLVGVKVVRPRFAAGAPPRSPTSGETSCRQDPPNQSVRERWVRSH